MGVDSISLHFSLFSLSFFRDLERYHLSLFSSSIGASGQQCVSYWIVDSIRRRCELYSSTCATCCTGDVRRATIRMARFFFFWKQQPRKKQRFSFREIYIRSPTHLPGLLKPPTASGGGCHDWVCSVGTSNPYRTTIWFITYAKLKGASFIRTPQLWGSAIYLGKRLTLSEGCHSRVPNGALE